MTEPRSFVPLTERAVLAVRGEDAGSFLQGLISNDIAKATPARAIFAALLTAQGKYLFDFLIAATEAGWLIETEADRLPDLLRRLTMYRLRAKVELDDQSAAYRSYALPGALAAGFELAAEPGACRAFGGGLLFVDPRLAALGLRAILPAAAGDAPLRAAGLAPAERPAYDRLRLALGVPEGSGDLAVERATLLESGFEELHGVDFQKGCFVGQELTARMKYRGLVKKRLLPVRFDGPAPAPGTIIRRGAKEAGEIRSSLPGQGLALLRLEQLQAAGEQPPLLADDTIVTPVKPNWVNF